MKVLALAPFALLFAGCSVSVDSGNRFQATVYQHFSQPHLRLLRVGNIAGSITIDGTPGNTVRIDAVKHADHRDALDRTQIVVKRTGDVVNVETRYALHGFAQHDASVEYTIDVPASAAIDVSDVSGRVIARGGNGDITVRQVSGPVVLALGVLKGSRSISVSSVSGGIDLLLSPRSDADVRLRTLSGKIRAFFPLHSASGFIGRSAHAVLGHGAASIEAHAVSGSILVKPENSATNTAGYGSKP